LNSKTALITGASSGIGEACAIKLLSLGYQVYAIARDFSKSSISHSNFIPIEMDLTKRKDFPKIENLHLLIHSAGVGYFAPHEELSNKEIEEMISLNLTAPLLLSRFYLRSLKQHHGYIFNINSISGVEPALFGAAYGASKAGLSHFGTSLFKEARKSGLKVINIHPDITKTAFFDNLHFRESDDALAYIAPEDIADIIEDVLNKREGTVITDITIQPQKFQIQKKQR
jgi:short-subunit dehydrogenase